MGDWRPGKYSCEWLNIDACSLKLQGGADSRRRAATPQMPSAWGLARWVLRGDAAWALQVSGWTRSYSTQLPDNLLPVVGTAAGATCRHMRRRSFAVPPALSATIQQMHPPHSHSPPCLTRR